MLANSLLLESSGLRYVGWTSTLIAPHPGVGSRYQKVFQELVESMVSVAEDEDCLTRMLVQGFGDHMPQ